MICSASLIAVKIAELHSRTVISNSSSYTPLHLPSQLSPLKCYWIRSRKTARRWVCSVITYLKNMCMCFLYLGAILLYC